MSRSLRAGVGAFLATVLVAATVVLAGPSSAQLPPGLSFQPTGNEQVQVGTGSLMGAIDVPCDAVPAASAFTATINGVPAPTVAVTVVDQSTFTVTVPGGLFAPLAATDSEILMSLTCQLGGNPYTQTGTIVFGEIDVTKAVVGDAPAGAAYTVSTTCTPSRLENSVQSGVTPQLLADPVTKTFSITAGATVPVFTFRAHSCVFTETDAKGATTSVITPGTVDTTNPIAYPVLITNTFPEAVVPDPPKFTG